MPIPPHEVPAAPVADALPVGGWPVAGDLAGSAPAESEAAEILVMFSHIERAVSRLPRGASATLPAFAFAGFDPRREAPHYRAARALIAGSGFFDEFQSRRLASAAPMLERYRALFGRFDLERRLASAPADFTFERIRRVLLLH